MSKSKGMGPKKTRDEDTMFLVVFFRISALYSLGSYFTSICEYFYFNGNFNIFNTRNLFRLCFKQINIF